MASAFSWLASMLEQPFVHETIGAVIVLGITAALAKVASRALRHFLRRDNNPLPNASIFINIARAVIWLLGGSMVLDACYGINVSALIAALGVGGIAVSLGFQDTLANLIGGLQVTFMNIVKPGDNIEVGTSSGVVQDVTWRHTTIKDGLGQTVIIPNSIISKTALTHLLPATRVTVPFAVPHAALAAPAAAHELDQLAAKLAERAAKAAGGISPVIAGPTVSFTDTTELGYKGVIALTIEDATQTSATRDAVIRSICDLLR